MNCTKCGFSTLDHPSARRELFSTLLIVDKGLANCELTEAQSILAAQRHAAAVMLWAMRSDWGVTYGDIHVYQQALRDCGIQRPRKSEVEK